MAFTMQIIVIYVAYRVLKVLNALNVHCKCHLLLDFFLWGVGVLKLLIQFIEIIQKLKNPHPPQKKIQ